MGSVETRSKPFGTGGGEAGGLELTPGAQLGGQMLKDLCFDAGYVCQSDSPHLAVKGRYLWNFTTFLSLLRFDLCEPGGRGTQDGTG